MGIFSSIKNAIFGNKEDEVETTPAATAAAPDARPAIEAVDVEARLNSIPGSDKLNWRSSIVDLMKLIKVDSSLSNRKELAQELGYTGELNGSAEMNIWLHKATMKALADNGGTVPADLLD